jgi:hypothetical protein
MSSLMAESVAGLAERQGETVRVPLLDDVATAAERMRAAEADRQVAREELREKVRAARAEGIPFAVIGRAAGLSRERVRQLHAGN